MTNKQYKFFAVIIGFLAICQLPFQHLPPTRLQANTLVEKVWPTEKQTQVQKDFTYRELMGYWITPTLTITLLSLASFFAYRRKSYFFIFYFVAVIYYILAYDYKLIVESPASLKHLISIHTSQSYGLMYDIVINYLLFPTTYLVLTLVYIKFLTSHSSGTRDKTSRAP